MSVPDHQLHDRLLARSDHRDRPELWSAGSSRGMVATAHYLATNAGADVLARGGNAVDAAVAASLALAVCEPAGSGLGGMAMMLIHDPRTDRTFLIEGACRAPRAATPAVVTGAPRYRGYRAVAVPTHVAVLRHALATYGTMSPAAVLAPAIRLADDGFPLTAFQHRNLVEYRTPLHQSTAAPLFLDADGGPFGVGVTFRQPVLAATLQRLAGAGFDDFYRGEIARAIIDDMHRHGGFIGAEDLQTPRLCREAPPIRVELDDLVAYSAGPPAGGAALLQMLNLWSRLPGGTDPDSPRGVVMTAEIIRQARRDRQRYRLRTEADDLGEAGVLLTTGYAQRAAERLLARIARGERRPAPPAAPARDAPGETSHLSVMDAGGLVVALTQSIERSFGAAVATPTLGFLYNGYLRAFKVVNQQHPHYLRPGTPARSNAAPTLVFRKGRPWAAVGSTGSERMASGILQVITRLRHQGPFEAVHAPRLHATPDRRTPIEQDRFAPDCLDALVRQGFTLVPLEPYSFTMGGVQLVVRDGDTFVGVGEPRRDGAAAGP